MMTKTQKKIQRTAKKLAATACPQPTYDRNVRLHLHTLRFANGDDMIVRFIYGDWLSKHVYDVADLCDVGRRLQRPVAVVHSKNSMTTPSLLEPSAALAIIAEATAGHLERWTRDEPLEFESRFLDATDRSRTATSIRSDISGVRSDYALGA